MIVKKLKGDEVDFAVESENVVADTQANAKENPDHIYATLLDSNTSSGE